MHRCVIGLGMTLALAGGCEALRPNPVLTADSFHANTVNETRNISERSPNPPERSNLTVAQVPPARPKSEPVQTISPVVKESIGAQTPAPATNPLAGASITTKPSIGHSSGTYLTVGGVIAEVNGTPIYADKVLAVLDKEMQ